MELDNLELKIQSNAQEASSGIDKLTSALSNLKNVTKGGAGLTAVKNQLEKLNTALSGIRVNSGKIGELAKALNQLSGVQKASGLSSTVNALRKLPEITKQLKGSELSTFAAQMTAVANAVRPLATEMQRVSNGFAAFPIRIQRLILSNTGLAASNTKVSKSYGVLGTGISGVTAKFGIYLATFQHIAAVMGNWVNKSNSYIENMNLFSVAMGDAAEEAYNYAVQVNRALGIDTSEWIRNQGVFKQITSGFGVVEDQANLMSKVLTQIGYDISSFFNISIEESMQKVQSGISGELEPLRRLGYALDQATLQEIAYAHGIDESITKMTQAEKSYLRFFAIVEQSENVMGDMSRTIQTPANAMRILNQQITQLQRALGNLLLPILQVIIPWVQAFVVVLTDAIQALANFFGFELPTIDYSGMDNIASSASGATDAVEDTAGALGDAAGAAKKLKDYTLGIDELNILRPDTDTGASSSGGAGASSSVGDGLGLDLSGYDYDFLGNVKDNLDDIKGKVKELIPLLMTIGSVLLGWKLTRSAMSAIDFLKGLSKSQKITAGIGLAITGFSIEAMGGYDIGYNGLNLANGLQTLIGSALGIGGSLVLFGTGPAGWTIGILAALTIGIASFAVGYNQRQIDDEIERRFGDIVLSVEEAKEYAERIMSTPISIQLDAYVEAKTNAQEAIENYLESSENLSTLVWKASVGFDVEPDEIMSAVDTMVSNAQTVLDTQKGKYIIAVNVGFSDSNIQAEMSEFVNTYFANSASEMTRLGEELKSEMLDALADGVIDEEEMEAITNLQKEINEITATVADAEYRANLTNVTYGMDLSYDSITEVIGQMEPMIQEQLDSVESIHLDALAAIELKYKTDGNYDEYIAAIEDEMRTYSANKAEVSADAFQPLVEKFNSAFSDALSESKAAFDTPVEDLITHTFAQFNTDETGILVDGSISDFMSSVQTQWQEEFKNLDVTPETREALSQTLEALRPSAEQLQQIADDAKAAGQKVPDAVSEGLHDYYSLAAITGNMDAINYLLGEKLSTDPNFLEALQKAEDAGVAIDDSIARGLLDNVEIKNNADGTISLINDAIGTKVVELTPELVDTLKSLGINLSDGLLEGADEEMQASEGDWRDWAIWPWNWFKDENEINSPSKLFESGGGFLMQGLLNGMSGWDGDFQRIFKSIINSGITMFNSFIGWINSKLRISWPDLTIGGQKIISGGSFQLFTIPYMPYISMYKHGGFPEPGELFLANEPGNPEMVGSIGGRTAVANNGQITEAIAQAVYQAVVSAQNEQAQQPININNTLTLEGKQIYRNQQEVRRSMGYRMTTSTIPV